MSKSNEIKKNKVTFLTDINPIDMYTDTGLPANKKIGAPARITLFGKIPLRSVRSICENSIKEFNLSD